MVNAIIDTRPTEKTVLFLTVEGDELAKHVIQILFLQEQDNFSLPMDARERACHQGRILPSQQTPPPKADTGRQSLLGKGRLHSRDMHLHTQPQSSVD